MHAEEIAPARRPCAGGADAAGATPVVIDCARGWCAGWYHPAAAARDLVVVLCPPLGVEAVSGYGILVQLATHLAAQGLPVLRFDYHGTGESEGGETDPGRVDAWLASIEAAAAHARRLSGARHVALIGVRLGALLALEAAARTTPTQDLVLWAPCPTGRSFVRELRMGGSAEQDASVRSQGYWYSAQTLHDLAALDPFQRPCAARPRVLVVGRDDLQLEQPLAGALARRGAEVDFRVLPGYAAMLQNGRFAGRVDDRLLAPVARWLLQSPRAAAVHDAPRAVPAPAARCAGAVRDTPVRFGPQSQLCGVLSEPAGSERADGGRAIVLLNAGHAYRIGPHGLYVQLARTLAASGHRVLRVDLAGIGDSGPAEPAQGSPELYSLDSLDDVRGAVDWLAALGVHSVVLAGLCSGAYLAFQASLRDPRVGGVVLMNPRLLEWSPRATGDSWESSRELYPKPARAYGRALLRPSVWRRLVTGDVSLRWIVQAFGTLIAARVRGRLRKHARSDESPLGKMRRLCQRGTRVLLLASDDAESHQYVQFHFGPAGKLLRTQARFHWTCIPDADHTFTRRGNVEAVAERILDYLRHPAGESAAR